MKAKTFLVLVIALMLSVGLSLWLLQQDVSQDPADEPLIDNAASLLGSLNKITIQQADGMLFSAELSEDAAPEWQATHLNSEQRFPVDREALAALVSALNQAEKLEAKTNRPQNYERLGVNDIDAEGARSKLVTLSGPSTEVSLLIGDQASSGLGSFVRFTNEAQTWLINQTVLLPQDQSAWLQNPALTVPIENVLQVERVALSDDTHWVIAKDAQAQWRLESREHELKYPSILNNTIDGMLTAEFDRVLPASALDLPDTPSIQLRFTLSEPSSTTLEIDLFDVNEEQYVRYRVASHPWLSDWVFGVSSFTYGQFNKTNNDFVDSPQPASTAQGEMDAENDTQ